MDEEGVLRIGDFVYQFPSRGKVYRLTVPLKLPYQDNSRELAVRLIRIHKIPFHLEDDLFEKLEAFSEAATLQMLDQQAENNLYGGSVFETVRKGLECTCISKQSSYIANCVSRDFASL